VALLAAQATIGVALGLPGFVVAVADALLGVVLLDPGEACPELVEGMCLVSTATRSPNWRSGGSSRRKALTVPSSRNWRARLGSSRSTRPKCLAEGRLFSPSKPQGKAADGTRGKPRSQTNAGCSTRYWRRPDM
jgi:hypothetical protein